MSGSSPRQKLSLRRSTSRRPRHISPRCPSPIDRSGSFPSSLERRLGNTTSPFKRSRRCSKPALPSSRWTTWSSAGDLLWSGNWRRRASAWAIAPGTRQGDSCCIRPCSASRVNLGHTLVDTGGRTDGDRSWSCAVVNVVSNKVVRLLGKDETARWMNLALYQGAPAKKGFSTIVSRRIPFMRCRLWLIVHSQAMAASANPLLAEREARDPTLFCTALKKSRFYLFSRLEPECVLEPGRSVSLTRSDGELAGTPRAAETETSSTKSRLGTSSLWLWRSPRRLEMSSAPLPSSIPPRATS